MRRPPASLVLDNEAVQALLDPTHPKHRLATGIVVVGHRRNRKAKPAPRVIVPVAVRIEAGWDRTAPTAALINHLTAAHDAELGADAANRATQLRRAADVSVVDATVGQAAEAAPQPALILTSDVDDMTRLAAHAEGDIRVVAL